MMKANYIHPICLVGKRLLDIFGAAIGLSLTLPLFPIIAIIIKVDSRGPVFFRQERVGRIWKTHKEHFFMIKFRTMVQEAESQTGEVWATKNDPRITSVGNFLRKTRLDELPQFLNVLAGDMSLIGPRPERPGISDDLEEEIPFYLERTYGVTPGITGLAQVNQGYDETLDDVRSKLAYDLAYSVSLHNPKQWILMDISIAFKTVMVMILGRGQ
jgi:lipopolysaccharide/colanic/teichoic acid biosynthesis glycosyltransferase